ncbi:MAG: response regulator [Deltaproteobacteria bacterium]|nr:response regulator [Deltaproteobacteria bacterium]
MNEEELLKRLREAFKTEAQERLGNMSSGLVDLEKTTDPNKQKPILEAVFREAHSLKGAARSVNLMAIETLCQSIEGVFASIRRDEIHLSAELFDVLHHSLKAMEDVLAAPEEGLPSDDAKELATLAEQLRRLQQGEAVTPVSPPKPSPAGPTEQTSAKPSISETVRISTSKLDSLLRKGEELISLKLMSSQHLANLRDVLHSIEAWNRKWSEYEPELKAVSGVTRKEDETAPLSEFIQWSREHIRSLEREMRTLTKGAVQDRRSLGMMVDDLVNDMRGIAMLPMSTLLDIFPRMIREMSREQGKAVDLVLAGGEIEVDRRILEEMRDPLTHLLRNTIDHGIEAPEKRKALKKDGCGTIRLSVSQVEGGKIDILLSDDGGGIDIPRVREKAASLGILPKEDMARLDDRAALSLILQSGVSTSPIITEISGRGLGLAIVSEKVEKLGGLLSIESETGRGTSFRIQLPVTLATFRGVLVQVAQRPFIIPSAQMDATLKVDQDQVKTVENRATIPMNGRTVSLVELAPVLNLGPPESGNEESGLITVVVLGTGEKRVAFRVDAVLGEQEVLVKGLGKQLVRVPNIAGATVLGTGQVVPVLNVHDLLKAPSEAAAVMPDRKVGERGAVAPRKSILIAEDSITSRMLLKNILEAAGYSVKTAVDGVEAYTALKTEKVDLVVSDVEMPRMDGFELTAKIRDEAAWVDMPVVLVTGLESREDREKGIDVGANAYIVKSSFDQSNLLEVIRRMI